MNNTEFIYWLQGMLEYTDISNLSEEQSKVLLNGIKDHLKLVMKKVTPPRVWEVEAIPKKSEKSEKFWESIRKSTDRLKPFDPPPSPYQPYWLDTYFPKTDTDLSTWTPYRGKPGELVC